MGSIRDRIAALSLLKRTILETRLHSRRSSVAVSRIQRRANPHEPVVLSFAQQRLWFLYQLDPTHSFYNLPFATRLTGPLQVHQLEKSINVILHRHEALRTRFAMVNGQPMQIVSQQVSLRLELLDLGGLPGVEQETEVARLCLSEAHRPFNLERDLLFRATLLRLSEFEHVLLMTMHHIVSDGWSMGILYREVSFVYAEVSAGRFSPLPELPIQYADFAIWQRAYMQGEVLEALISYWKKKLAGMPPVLELPTDRLRPRVQTFEGAVYALAFPHSVLGGLKAIASGTGATLFMILLAAFKVLLFRYSGQPDIVVGSPIANRTRREIEGLIGFFVNTLVLRTDLSGDPIFAQLLSSVRETVLEAFAHQELPFENLVGELQPERNLSHNPIFQVMFVLQNHEAPGQASPLPSSPQTGVGTSKFDLTLCVTEMLDGLTVAFEYNTMLFDQSTVIAMARNFQTVLENVIVNVDQRISGLLRQGSAEHERLILECSGDCDDLIPATPIFRLFEVQAELRPETAALRFQGQRFTYKEVNARANRLARALRNRGVGPEVLVGLCLERSPEMIIALLAILKAGGAYLPLDPLYPRDRIAYMLEDSGATMVLTEEPLVAILPECGTTKLYLTYESLEPEAHTDNDLEPVTTPDNLVYVIYTSGSTGRPKGVMVQHGGLSNVIAAQQRAFGIDSEKHVLQFASLCFDASMFEIALAIGAGATLCLAPREAILPGLPLVQLLRNEKINVVLIPPSALAALPEVAFPDLQVIIAAGEACPMGIVARWSQGRRFFNAYGPTEVSIWSAVAACKNMSSAPPIGRAICNTQAYILDEQFELAPDGAPGEIYLGGVGVARGYLNRPDLTAERYLPDLFSKQPGARIYRTGDRACRRSNGEIQYLGRTDQQIKIRGYRIEPGEIAASMLGHPAIREAVLVPQRTPSGEVRLLAFFVPEPEQAPEPAELRNFLRGRLPDFMLPSAFISLDALPRTANDKLDRDALLRVADSVRETPDDAAAAPCSETEKRLVRIWCEVLEREQVGIYSNFFELGGHSLLATRLLSRINSEFRLNMSLRLIFELPTISEFARQIEDAGPDQIQVEPPIVPVPRRLVVLPVHS